MAKRRFSAARLPVDVLETDPQLGLTREQAAYRLRRGWSNRTSRKTDTTVWQIIRKNCFTYFNLVFVVMAVLMLLVGAPVLNLTFMVIVTVNACIGTFQELRAKRAVDKLALVAAQTLLTVRDGELISVPSDRLVRDDIVAFQAGDQICADALVCTGTLLVNEALLTGEADSVEKNPGDTLLSGSFVVAGSSRCRLTGVGDDGYAAQLSAAAKKQPAAGKSEMMRSLDKLIRFISVTLIPLGLALFFSQMRSDGFTLQAGVEATVAALMGLIPDGLFLLTSIALAVSALKLTRDRVLIQDMNCIETLARVDVLCVDKTGTITQPDMTLSEVIQLSPADPKLLTAVFSAQPAENATARALQTAFRGECNWILEQAVPFTSETKWAGYRFREHGTYVTGAPEILLGDRFSELRDRVEPLYETGHRVLLAASYEGCLDQLDCAAVTPLALLVLQNRIRPEAEATFAYFAAQGVTVKVISGDAPAAASAIACKAGIAGAERSIDTTALETDADFLAAAQTYTVFGRVTPEKKQKLIRAMKAAGHTVAMTGDGVNDVLAMKESDCSIAMASGAQAANQIASMVLLDSDFGAMPGIVNEGRRVINNIRRSATLFLVKNIFSFGMTLATLISGLPFPLESFHMSIVSSLTIGIPGFFLALEPNYARVQGRFLSTAYRKAFPGGLTNLLVVILAQILGQVFHLPQGDTQSITTAVLCAVGLAVLFWVCLPFSLPRRLIWGAMAICVAGAFFVVPPITGFLTDTSFLAIADPASWLVLLIVLIAAPTAFLVIHRLFALGEKLFRKGGKPC